MGVNHVVGAQLEAARLTAGQGNRRREPGSRERNAGREEREERYVGRRTKGHENSECQG